MDQQLTDTRRRFNEAVTEFGIDAQAAESLWAYAASVGMNIDDFSLSILLYGARQEKTARDVEIGIKTHIDRFAKSVDQLQAAAASDLEAKSQEAMAAAIQTMATDAREALSKAVEQVADSRIDEVRAYQKRSNWSTATACAALVVLASTFVFAGGYVLGRENTVGNEAIITELAKHPQAGEWLAIASLPSNRDAIRQYCTRGSPNLTSIEGKLQCTLPVFLTDGTTMSRGLKGGLRQTVSQLEAWLMKSSWWVLLLIGSVGALATRKALRKVSLFAPIRWLFDIPKPEDRY